MNKHLLEGAGIGRRSSERGHEGGIVGRKRKAPPRCSQSPVLGIKWERRRCRERWHLPGQPLVAARGNGARESSDEFQTLRGQGSKGSQGCHQKV
jgi:hypothetical protein